MKRTLAGFAAMAVATAVLAMSGCSSYGEPINGQRALSPEEMRLQAVENKTVDLERRLSGVESSRLGSQMADDVRGLHGQIEELAHANDQLRQQNDALSQRLQKLEALAAASQGTAPAPPGTDPGSGTAPMTPAGGSPPGAAAAPGAPIFGPPPAATGPQEEAMYNASFAQLKASHYDDAIRGFRTQLDQFPQGSFADNAWYWMGEAQYVKGDSPSALKSFQSLIDRFPSSPKAPDALLETGLINLKSNNNAAAKTAFQRVVRDFPNSTAANTARSRLAQLH